MNRAAVVLFFVVILISLVCFAPISTAQPLTGTKTIGGTAPDYATFRIADSVLMARGVGTGGVTFEVRAGVYAERCSLSFVSGASQANPITFHATPGTVTINGSNIPTTGQYAVVALHGARWVTFDGINVVDSTTGGGNTWLRGYGLFSVGINRGAQHNTIMNCSIALNRRNDSTAAIYGQGFGFNDSVTCSYNRFLNLQISNCQHGVYLIGSGSNYSHHNEIGSTSAGLTFASRTVIGGSTPNDIGSHNPNGIYVSYQDSLSIHDLDVRNVTNTDSSASYPGAIVAMDSMHNFSIYRCRVYNVRGNTGVTGTTYYPSMNGMCISTPAGYTANIYNNMVYNITSNIGTPNPGFTCLRGILTINNTGTVRYYNNTVVVDHNGGDMITSGISTNSTAPGLVIIKDNIIANRTTGQVGTTYEHRCLGGAPDSADYNLFWMPDTNMGRIAYGIIGGTGTSFATLADWQTTGRDAHSRVGNPLFLNDSNNFHIQTGSPASSNAIPIALIATDIDGEFRSTTAPDIGADETVHRAMIVVVRPNGGEAFPTGVVDTIRWVSQGFTGNVRVQLNRNYPTGTWDSVATVAATNGRVAWTPTAPQTTNARIRVMSIDSAAAGDTSDANFSIGTFVLTILRPNGGEILTPNTSDTIRWNSVPFPSTVTIRFNSAYPGGTWSTVTTGIVMLSAGQYVWTVPNVVTNSARIAIIPDGFTTVADTSNANFWIRPFTLTISHPNGGDSLLYLSSDTIRWNPINSNITATIRLTTSYPTGPWTTIGTGVPLNSSRFGWMVPGTMTSQARIAIVPDSLAMLADTSDANFTIMRYTVAIQHPNGGDTLYIGTRDTVRWMQNRTTGNYVLTYTTIWPNPTWIEVVRDLPLSNQQFVWTVPNISTTTARIRIVPVTSPQMGDTSDANFVITSGRLQIMHPNGGDTLSGGMRDTIRWVQNAARGTATIRFNANYPTGTWSNVADNVPLTALRYVWTVPNQGTTTARIAVVPDSTPQFADTSDANFRINVNSLLPLFRGIPERFDITQAYPNPFNRELQLTLAIPLNGQLEVTVTDMLGREVSKLYSGEVRAGYLPLHWRTDRTASGEFLVRARYGNNQIIKKVVYLK